MACCRWRRTGPACAFPRARRAGGIRRRGRRASPAACRRRASSTAASSSNSAGCSRCRAAISAVAVLVRARADSAALPVRRTAGATSANRFTEPAATAAPTELTGAAAGHRHNSAAATARRRAVPMAARCGSTRPSYKEVGNKAARFGPRRATAAGEVRRVPRARAAVGGQVEEATARGSRQRFFDFFPQARARASQRARAFFFSSFRRACSVHNGSLASQ